MNDDLRYEGTFTVGLGSLLNIFLDGFNSGAATAYVSIVHGSCDDSASHFGAHAADQLIATDGAIDAVIRKLLARMSGTRDPQGTTTFTCPDDGAL